VSTAASRLYRFTPQTASLLIVAALAWLATVRGSLGMGTIPGTKGLTLGSFIAIWTLMMSAMMLPSVAPLASMYARSVRYARPWRLAAFASGYLLVWATASLPFFGLASLVGNLADGHTKGATIAAAVMFGTCGLYQLTPLKRRCLKHCRSPLSLLLRYGSWRGKLRDLRAGLHHGAYCLGCCWALFVLLIALGLMNLVVMIVLSGVVLIEKLWSRGEGFSRVVAAAALGLAIAVFFVPELAPGLVHNARMGGMGL